jgi:uncharacterized phage protein (TIGR02218 family)
MRDVDTTALALRLDRTDGVALGLTSHDRTLIVNGLTHAPHPGLSVSTIRHSGTLEPGGLDISGGLSSAAISDADLAAGRWNGAQLTLSRVDWSDPDSATTLLFSGHFGAVQMADGRYNVEVMEARPVLAAAARIPFASPGCRARFCDAACGLNAARFTAAALVTAMDGAAVTLNLPPARLPDFVGGRLRWLEGDMRGLWSDVAAVESGGLVLASPPTLPINAPTRVQLIEGCDHRLSTCAMRFGNAVNFRGEPHLPGMDLLTRYPGG